MNIEKDRLKVKKGISVPFYVILTLFIIMFIFITVNIKFEIIKASLPVNPILIGISLVLFTITFIFALLYGNEKKRLKDNK